MPRALVYWLIESLDIFKARDGLAGGKRADCIQSSVEFVPGLIESLLP
jgi:hypothetical protein